MEKMTPEKLKNDFCNTESGDGLYKDIYEDGKCTYKGINPNNYIKFNNEMWRIISIGADNTIKIMRNESIGDMAFDTTGGTYGNNNWDRPADIKTYLNDTYFPTITTNQDKIVSHTWSIGKREAANTNLANQVNDENGTQSQTASVGMITSSEFLRANTNTRLCASWRFSDENYTTCKTTNWMYNIVLSGNNLWTISHVYDQGRSVVYVVGGTSSFSLMMNYNDANSSKGVSPVLYLTSDITLSGTGTEKDTYVITN